MADRTWSVKVSDEFGEKVKQMIEFSGDNAKEWFEKVVAVAEVHHLKEDASDYKEDLTELEVHTTRMYELVANMVRRAAVLKEATERELLGKIEQKDTIIDTFQAKVKEANEQVEQATSSQKQIEEEKQALLKEMEEMSTTHENNQSLIVAYKEKIELLQGQVNEYQAYQEENRSLKEQIEQQAKQHQSQLSELSAQIESKQQELSSLQKEMQTLQKEMQTLEINHQAEMERVTEKKELEKDKALLQLEKEYQAKIQELNEAHHEKLNELYKTQDELRQSYEGSLKRNGKNGSKES